MRKNIIVLKRPILRNPYFIAAWPGIGDVALRAAIFLKDKLKAEEFAAFNPRGFFEPQGVEIVDQLISTVKLPEGKFYFYKNKSAKNDLIIFISPSQPLFEKSYEYTRQIVSFAGEFKVKMAFSFAALPSPIEHTTKPAVWAATSHKESFEELKKAKIHLMSAGNISGLNGLILGVAKERNIPGICLLGEIPFYTMQIENPSASLSVLDILAKLVNVKINFIELEEQANLIKQEIEKFINFLKDPEAHQRPIGIEEIEKIKDNLSAYTKVPESARKKIENLFEQAKDNINSAADLKKELDHWSIYKEYEDRFLDLFKKPLKENR